jgi:hypothetical protein
MVISCRAVMHGPKKNMFFNIFSRNKVQHRLRYRTFGQLITSSVVELHSISRDDCRLLVAKCMLIL